ncbi:MAG: PA14 domain-containing protein [Spirosomataceae bacterium]
MKYRFLLLITIFWAAFSSRAQQNCVGTAGQIKWHYWMGFKSTPDSLDLFALENFPSRPDGTQILGSTKAPVNFTDYYASMMRGYITVSTTDNYKFNITGDDRVFFYLSTDNNPANKRRRASLTTFTGVTEHNRQAGQTSQTIQLVAGQNYYFEILAFEGTGGDHSTLYWRRNSNPDTTWRVIDYTSLKEYACESNCPLRGTACNDNNPNTINDQQDGFCNCVGTPQTANACVGEKGVIDAYYYDSISGTYVEPDLTNSPKFPLTPDRKEKLKGAYGPLSTDSKDNYGTLVQGYLSVPMSGMYEFNITGDGQTYFFLSKNDSIEYKQYHQAIVISGVDRNDFNNSSFQRIAPLYLEKGKFYYYEFRHKENSWRDHFNLFWKTPFHERRDWKRVSDFYLFDYKCEISCVPQGTLCDDGNPFTNNDRFNNSCECVGTPCSGLDCDDSAARYQAYAACAPTDNLVATLENSWNSCSPGSPNPNTARSGLNYWIRYDFGDIYKFQGTKVWNFNVQGYTDRGFKNVYVDYSLDGTNWTQLGGTYFWNQAPGLSDYSGFAGPNFNDVKARYVLISAIDNWGAGCSGFSKITFDATLCNPSGTACDDNDPLTMYDKFDANCNCRGININCASDTLKLDRITLADGTFKAKKVVNSESIVPTTKNVTFTAGNSIVLMPGFKIDQSAIFTAKIEDCLQQAFTQNQMLTASTVSDSTASEFAAKDSENKQIKKIIFRLNKPSQVKLVLKDSNQNVIVTIIDQYYQNLGTQIKLLPTNKLQKGEYWIELTVDKEILREKLVVE